MSQPCMEALETLACRVCDPEVSSHASMRFTQQMNKPCHVIQPAHKHGSYQHDVDVSTLQCMHACMCHQDSSPMSMIWHRLELVPSRQCAHPHAIQHLKLAEMTSSGGMRAAVWSCHVVGVMHSCWCAASCLRWQTVARSSVKHQVSLLVRHRNLENSIGVCGSVPAEAATARHMHS